MHSELTMVVTDLDGTLLGPQGRVSPADLATLQRLGGLGVARVIATGRSLHSARRVLDARFPLDYLIFSSGGGIVEWSSQKLLCAHHLTLPEVTHIADMLVQERIDFMLHRPIPDNHLFAYHTSGAHNPDFATRLALYREYATPLVDRARDFGPACQFVAITRQSNLYDNLRQRLEGLTVIRTTSPLDGSSLWIEIFPLHVSKAQAAQWLCGRLSLTPCGALAIGNDYNDLDLLEWAQWAVVVANAPPALKSAFAVTASNHESGFSRAVLSRLIPRAGS